MSETRTIMCDLCTISQNVKEFSALSGWAFLKLELHKNDSNDAGSVGTIDICDTCLKTMNQTGLDKIVQELAQLLTTK